MRNRSIYAKLFPKMKDTPGPLGNTGRPEPDAMSMGPGPEDLQEAAAPVEAVAHESTSVPKPPSSKPYDPTAEQPVTATTPADGSDPEEERRQAALIAAANPSVATLGGTEQATDAEAAQIAASAGKKGLKYSPSTSPTGGPLDAAISDANKYRQDQITNAAGIGTPVAYQPQMAPIGTTEPAGYADRSAKLEEQSRAALRTPKQQKRVEEDAAYEEKKKAALTYENPRTAAEKAQNRKDELRFMRDNPRNEDHGVKGFIRETLQNFFHGLSMAQGVPGISIPQALMLGGTGAGLGMVNRKWNEQRMAEQKLPGAMQDVAFESDQETKASTNRAREATARTQGINAQTAQIKAMTDAGATTLIEDADGRLWNRDKSGKNTTPFKDPITGQQMTKKNVAVTLPDGRVVYTSGDKAIDRQIAEDYRNAQNAFEAKKLNQADLDDYQKRLDAWSTANVDHEIKRRAILTDGEALVQAADAQMAQAEAMDDPVEKTKALSEAASKKAQGVAKIKQANEWKTLPKPTPPSANLKAPSAGSNIAGKLYPSPAALRPAFPNKTDDEIRKIITGQGGKFVN